MAHARRAPPLSAGAARVACASPSLTPSQGSCWRAVAARRPAGTPTCQRCATPTARATGRAA
eukprot:3277296-Prymnesium_polylepis.1